MDRNELIMLKVKEAYDYLVELGYEVLQVNLYGSQNYNLDLPESDYDFKAVVLPSISQVIFNNQPASKVIEFNGGQIDVKSVSHMFKIYEKQNIQFIEGLFSKWYFVNPIFADEWQELRDLAPRFAYADRVKAMNAMVGFVGEKDHALAHPYAGKLQVLAEHGYDGKQLSHAARVVAMLQKYVRGVPYAELLVPNEEERVLMLSFKQYQPQLSLDDAKRMSNDYLQLAKSIKEEVFAKGDIKVDIDAYDMLHKIQENILVKHFVNQLKNYDL